VSYILSIRTENAAINWQVGHRYTNFEKLHNSLPNLPDKPKLPPKGILTAHDDEFLERRRQDLEQYILEVLANDELRRHPQVLSFLGAEDIHSVEGGKNRLHSFGFVVRSGAYSKVTSPAMFNRKSENRLTNTMDEVDLSQSNENEVTEEHKWCTIL